MSSITAVSVARPDRTAAGPFEVGVVQWTAEPAAGYWFVDPADAPEPFTVVGHAEEHVFIVEGRLRVQPLGGEPLEIGPGSSASFPAGVPVEWTVLEPTVEFFVYA